MSPEFLQQLRARTIDIGERWRALLHIEPVSGPLANPDALSHAIPQTIDQVLAMAGRRLRSPLSLHAARRHLPPCSCGHNPYRAFFVAGEQAMVESAIHIQFNQSPEARSQMDLVELIYAVRHLAKTEIDTFCSVCTYQGKTSGCHLGPETDAAHHSAPSGSESQ